jgi:hypothetical protein
LTARRQRLEMNEGLGEAVGETETEYVTVPVLDVVIVADGENEAVLVTVPVLDVVTVAVTVPELEGELIAANTHRERERERGREKERGAGRHQATSRTCYVHHNTGAAQTLRNTST